MSWHEGERTTVVGGLIFAVICLVLYYGLAKVLFDFKTLRTSYGAPIAADFANYWSASKLALLGKPALVYDVNKLFEIQMQNFGASHTYGSGWYYPPTFLLMVLPLGLMPYLTALLVWLSVTLFFYIIVLSRISSHPIILPLCIFSPGIYENIFCGQNSFLSGACLGGGLLLLERLPFVAGCLLGFLTYKPPLVILIFIALIFGRHWWALLGALAMSAFLAIASVVLFGYQVWIAYFSVMSIPMKYLELGQAPWVFTPTVFSAVLSAGFGVRTAYLIHGVVMLAVLAGVAWVWRKQTVPRIYGSVLVLGTFLFTPYGFKYELAILVLPLAWLWEEGRIHGRLPGELLLLLFGWLLPFLDAIVWSQVNIFQGKLQIGPVILLALFLLSLYKAAIYRRGVNP